MTQVRETLWIIREITDANGAADVPLIEDAVMHCIAAAEERGRSGASERIAELERKFHAQREMVEAAHVAFHEAAGTAYGHTPAEDNPAAMIRLVAKEAEERGRRCGDAERDELRATIAELLPMAERAHHADLGKHLCPDIASLPEGLRIAREGALLLRLHHPDLVPRDSAPREVPGPFAKGEDPAKCMHVWECHVYERGKDYCPYCFSMREEVPRDSGKEP